MGKVAFVSPQVDVRNGSVMVGIDLPAGTSLRPGLSVKVRIIAAEHKDCFVVPREAVVEDENGDSVISVLENETRDKETGATFAQATHKSVKAGLEENGMIEIAGDGLTEGMKVVTAGAFGLPAASRVKSLELTTIRRDRSGKFATHHWKGIFSLRWARAWGESIPQPPCPPASFRRPIFRASPS